MPDIKLETIIRKVEGIKRIQQRRIDIGDTYHEIGDALALNVKEAEYLLGLIKKER